MLKSILFFVLALSPLAALAQLPTATPSTNAASTNAPAASAPSAIATGDVVAQAETAKSQLQQYQADLNPDVVLAAVGDKLPALTPRITAQMVNDEPLTEARTSITLLQNSQKAWQSINSDINSIQDSLSDRSKKLDATAEQVNQLRETWQATLAANKASGPTYVVPTCKTVLAQIDATAAALRTDVNKVYDLQNKAAALAARAKTGSDSIEKMVDKAWDNIIKRDHPPLWSGKALTARGNGTITHEYLTFDEQVKSLQNFLGEKAGAVLANALLIALLAMAFFWLRNAVHELAQEKPQLSAADRIFETPVSAAVLAGLIAAHWLYPDQPALFHAAVGAVALIPTVIIIRRLIEPGLHPLLYITVVAYTFDVVRSVARPSGLLSRGLLIIELLALCLFLLALLRSHRQTTNENVPHWVRRTLRNYLHFTFVVLVVAGFANVLGYLQLSGLLSQGMLKSSYAAIIIYALVHVLDALALSSLYIRPMSGLRAVRRNQELIYKNVETGIRWGAFVLWALTALEMFEVRGLFFKNLSAILDYKVEWGWLSFDVGPMIAFPITVYAAFLLSRFIRFCLEEEIFPNIALAPGIPYALSMVTHYAVLLIGFYLALTAVGVDLTKFAVLGAAFGVGLGFGLQNIMNNFMSGLILLFERPIKVGDTIQLDANTVGRVERIGIRASVILLTNGAELIVPNGNLISAPVTNWTLSNCERVIELPVKITSKVDTKRVMEVLVHAMAEHPAVLKNPPPQALLIAPGATTQEFRVRAWIDSEDKWAGVTSDLSIAVNNALEKENIAQA